ncbi:S-formylglutathione hydrolase [Thalassotalea insulae]|uniref:S-formylglutathione hydrolase n=1 Tax=Thalassotalea insulae TaxID=2056778 RepID=A0ABQ6GRT7_9GAMM|nr:S-formylglutathione hydrolase [Thalassotalea insulae]GLX78668.1 S-formylglutathione hydrolase [Thalassotalea insulae]
MTITTINQHKVFGGNLTQCNHQSNTVNCTMRFSVFMPSSASKENPVPVLYWLSGLTCTDENFMQKAGALRVAEQLGIAIVAPDTSPRGTDVPDDSNQAYDFGLGAGFYVNASQAPWQQHYQMYDYIRYELPQLITQHFPVSAQRAISGHSMGGHGALVLALRNRDFYSSVSAFSPICHPVNCPWGEKAFSHYLGDNKDDWQQYDASILISKTGRQLPMLVHQGGGDEFLEQQLQPQALLDAAKRKHYPLEFNMMDGYDHSYYFISSFIEQHLQFHAQHFKR